MTRKIKVTGVPKDELDTEQLALAYWLTAKQVLRDRRKYEAAEKAKREARKTQGRS